MKRFLLNITIVIFLSGMILSAADTLHIAPCDKLAIGIFGDMICLSQTDGVLKRYVGDELKEQYTGDESSYEPILQEPLKPVLDGADRVYVLDAGTNMVIGWDRFLNIHSTTPLHEDILSPVAFTVTSEHDWLIYDDFFGQILQVHPGENFYTTWGDKSVTGDIELVSLDRLVFILMIDKGLIRVCDEEGTTIFEHILPKLNKINNIFPLGDEAFAISSDIGVYIWKPESDSLRYLSDLQHPIFCQTNGISFTLVSQDGAIVTIP